MTPPITSWQALDHYLLDRIEAHSADYLDDEVAQHVGPKVQQRALGRVAMCTEVRTLIGGMVAAERNDPQAAAVERRVAEGHTGSMAGRHV